jgi:hypothetical protein
MDDSRWIKWFAIATAVLTAVLVFLTIVLARYASRLDAVTKSSAYASASPASTPPPIDERQNEGQFGRVTLTIIERFEMAPRHDTPF